MRLTVIGIGLALTLSQVQAQQPLPGAPATNEASPPITAKPIEPIVPPIQRVLPPPPKLDPRLSAKPVGKGKPKPAVASRTVAPKTKAQDTTAPPVKPTAKTGTAALAPPRTPVLKPVAARKPATAGTAIKSSKATATTGPAQTQ